MTDGDKNTTNPHGTNKALRVLLVDDEHAMLRVITRALRSFDVTAVDCVEAAEELLESEHFDVVISDNSMPGKTGVDLLRFVAGNNPTVHRVMHSGARPEAFAELQQEGVLELFVLKPNFAALANYCQRLVIGLD